MHWKALVNKFFVQNIVLLETLLNCKSSHYLGLLHKNLHEKMYFYYGVERKWAVKAKDQNQMFNCFLIVATTNHVISASHLLIVDVLDTDVSRCNLVKDTHVSR
jgi:hypothetical protein